MKNLILLLIIICAVSDAYSQQKTITEDIKQQYLQVDSSDTKTVYCEVVGMQKFMSKKVIVTLDFGQKQKYFTDNRLFDETGKPIVFNTMVDAINYMSERGWKLHSTMLVGQNNFHVYHFVMQKKIKIKQ